MGPELIVAIAGPIIGGAISIFVWSNKKNYESMNTGFSSLNTSIRPYSLNALNNDRSPLSQSTPRPPLNCFFVTTFPLNLTVCPKVIIPFSSSSSLPASSPFVAPQLHSLQSRPPPTRHFQLLFVLHKPSPPPSPSTSTDVIRIQFSIQQPKDHSITKTTNTALN